MAKKTLPIDNRQEELARIVNDALENPKLVEALQAFQIGQTEYARAIAGTMNIKIFSSNSSNPGEKQNASMG